MPNIRLQTFSFRFAEQVLNSRLSIKRELEDAGIITGTYEASEGDPNEFEERRIRDDFDRFFETLGLSRLEA